jgi:excinuclease ABC subunit A
LIVIEHHLDVIRAADWAIELGPKGGAAGGHLIYTGTPAGLGKASTPTGDALRTSPTSP